MDTKTPITLLPRHAVCTGCGYSLAGLRLGSSCPECNASCEDALLEDSIYLAKPQYIARMRQGIRLVILSLILLVLMNVGSFVLSSLSSLGNVANESIFQAVWYVGTIATTSLTTVGWFMATKSDPSAGSRHPSRRMAKLLRITVVVMAGSLLLQMTILRSTPFMLGGLVQFLLTVAPLVCYMLFSTRYVQHVAHRFPGPTLKKASKRSFQLMVVLCLFFTFVLALFYWAMVEGAWSQYIVHLLYTNFGSLVAIYVLQLWILLRFASTLKAVHATALSLPPAEPGT